MILNESIILGRITPINNDKIHQNQEVYSNRGIMCTLKATHYKEPPKIMIGEYKDGR